MDRGPFLPLAALLIGLNGHAPLALAVPAKDGDVLQKDIRSEDQAWQYSGVELAKGQVAVITAKGMWKTNVLWRQKVGSAGKPGTRAGRGYLKPDAAEGCLLVRTGPDRGTHIVVRPR